MPLHTDALEACYQRLERPLYNVLLRLLWQPQDCQDVIHDACLRVWARRDSVDAATVDALVWTTALNLARNRLRWRKLWQFGASDALDGLPDETAGVDFLAQRRVRQALRKLPRQQREVLLLAEFSGLSNLEIADMLHIPSGTVASRKNHAMRQLKTLMETTDHA